MVSEFIHVRQPVMNHDQMIRATCTTFPQFMEQFCSLIKVTLRTTASITDEEIALFAYEIFFNVLVAIIHQILRSLLTMHLITEELCKFTLI